MLLPTVNRPDFLRTALASVARQSAVDRIGVVRVLENGGVGRSRAVCDEFADRLPIDYVIRYPALSAFEHGRLIYSEEENFRFEHLAVLHDDDWWAPGHLGASLSNLEPDGVVASYSAFFDVWGESSPMRFDGGLGLWFGAGYPVLTGPWQLGLPEVLLASLPSTPGRYSTLVAKTKAYRTCAGLLNLANPYDNDRMVAAVLAEAGRIAFNPVPGAFIRVHAGQDSRSFNQKDILVRMGQTTLWLFDQARKANIDLIGLLDARLNACAPEYLQTVIGFLSTPCLYGVVKNHKRLPRQLAGAWQSLSAQK